MVVVLVVVVVVVVVVVLEVVVVVVVPAEKIKDCLYTEKKENQISLIYKEIQSGAVAKSYMSNGLLIYGEIFAHFLIY